MDQMNSEFSRFVAYSRNQGRFMLVAFGFVVIFFLIDRISNVSLFDLAFGFGKRFYSDWGLPFIFLASIVEGVVFVNWYFPGSFAVLTGALLAREVVPPGLFIATVFTGFFLAFSLDYFIGRYGLYRIFMRFKFFRDRLRAAQYAVRKWAPVAFLTWYIHPQTGNFVATAAGILQYPFLKFLFLNAFAGLFWSTLWVGLVYMFGAIVLEILESYGYLVIMFALALWLVVGYIRERRRIVT